MVTRLAAGFPSSPVVNPQSGSITPEWRGFMLQLYARTGSGTGTSMPSAEAAVSAEAGIRASADAGLSANIVAETAARTKADAALTAQVLAEATRLQAQIVAETAARIAAGNTYTVNGAQTFTYTQATPSEVWGIEHDLNWFPSVTVVDSANSLVEGDVTYDSANMVTLRFASAFAGTAYLV